MSLGYVYLIMECNDQGNETYSSHNYRRIETWLHKKYETQKTLAQNEFFTLSNEQVISFIDDCKYIDQVINYMLQNNHFYN
jgi:hypothetical protein